MPSPPHRRRRSPPRPGTPPTKGRAGVPDPLTDAQRGVRLQKAMADAGVASRRKCEELIEAGRVRVNGQPVTALPAWVDPSADRIELDGEPLPRVRAGRAPSAGKSYVMVHKPRRVISTNDDPQGRPRVIDLVDAPVAKRLFPVGRLDADSTGLILLTNDGELANRLTHPRYGVTKQYLVAVRGRLGEADVQRLRDGLFLADRTPGRVPGRAPARVPGAGPGRAGAKRAAFEAVRIVKHERDRQRGDRTTLAITLREGQNREIRRLLARLGLKVRKLKRVAIGPLRLKGLAVGQWRPLDADEVRSLRQATRGPGRPKP